MKHRSNRDLLWTLLCASAVSAAANAQSNIDPDHKFAWGENIGWTHWQHDSPNPGDGVLVNDTFLSGFVWAENIGWINLGYGAPTDGVHYANTDDSDFGVNLDPNTGDLFGLGWGENVGWLNFDTRGKGDQRARIDCSEERFYGYVWGENVGWINLDDSEHYLSGAFEDACEPPPSRLDLFLDCMAGPNRPPEPTLPEVTIAACRDAFDCDVDDDVDLKDFSKNAGPIDLFAHAGTLTEGQASAVGYWSSGNDLSGTVAQMCVCPRDFAVKWTVESQPAGSGTVMILAPMQLRSGYGIQAPATTGEYVFRLDITNTATEDSTADTVTLILTEP